MSEALLRQVEGMVESELAGLFRFKGKSELQPVYRLISVRERRDEVRRRGCRGLTSYIGRNASCRFWKINSAPERRSCRRRGRRSRHRKVTAAV